jgi:hypothetical protein
LRVLVGYYAPVAGMADVRARAGTADAMGDAAAIRCRSLGAPREDIMKLYTPDGAVLMEIEAIEPGRDSVLIRGRIMGTMPMKAQLRAAELRRGVRFLNWKLARFALRALLTPARG